MKKILLVVMLVMISTLCYSGIYVKYQGYVDTDECTYLSMSTSSWIYAGYYDEENEMLYLNLQGVWYGWCGVPLNVVYGLEITGSPGQYFNYYIKGQYGCY